MNYRKSDPKDFTKGDSGTISGYFATFDHDHGDSYGDVIKAGAFKDTIARRKIGGHPFPLCWNHDLNTIIGRVTEICEDEKGAYFEAEFFPTEKAQEIRSTVKSGVLWQFSFAYDVLDAGTIKAGDGSTVNELRKLELYEISVVAIPANPRATLTDIKADDPISKTLSPELRAKRLEILNFIKLYEEEEREERRRLLKYIADMKKNDLEEQLEHYKRLEAQALKDIGKAEVEGRTGWKKQRLSALEAIQNEIKRLTDLKQSSYTGIKTGSRPLTVPKADFK